MDDVFDDTSNVSMSLGVIEGSELGRGFVETGVGRYEAVSEVFPFLPSSLSSCWVESAHTEDRATTLPLVANHSTHCSLSTR